MGNRRRRDPSSAVPHAEGQQGPKTRKRAIEQLESSPPEAPLGERLKSERSRSARRGRRRLVADREQHDEAEKNSELTRLAEDGRRRHRPRGQT